MATYRLSQGRGHQIPGAAGSKIQQPTELRPLNRYRLELGQAFRWQPRGPVMRITFATTRCWTTLPGLAKAPVKACAGARLHQPRAGPGFGTHAARGAELATAPGRPEAPCRSAGYTVLLAMRSWEFEALPACAARGAWWQAEKLGGAS